MSTLPPAATDPSPVPAPFPTNRCAGCAYDLAGLPEGAICPECGMPVGRSRRGAFLVNAAPEYVAKLPRGTVVVLLSVALLMLSILAGVAIVFLGGLLVVAGGLPLIVFVAAGVVLFLAGVAIFPIGWWMLSARDPGWSDDALGRLPRRIVRAAVVTFAAASILCLGLEAWLEGPFAPSVAAQAWRGTPAMPAVRSALLCLPVLAWIVQFYAAMVYVRWLAVRLPNTKVYDRARLLMWLGPLLLLMSCFLVPALVAMVLYYNMLEWVRVDLKRIREQQHAPS